MELQPTAFQLCSILHQSGADSIQSKLSLEKWKTWCGSQLASSLYILLSLVLKWSYVFQEEWHLYAYQRLCIEEKIKTGFITQFQVQNFYHFQGPQYAQYWLLVFSSIGTFPLYLSHYSLLTHHIIILSVVLFLLGKSLKYFLFYLSSALCWQS